MDYKKLATNVGLAFLAGFVTTFGAFTATTPKPVDKTVVISAAGAAAWAGFRAAVSLLKDKFGAGPVSVDA